MKNPYSEIDYCELYGPTNPDCQFVHYGNIFGIFDASTLSFRTLPGFTLFQISMQEIEAFLGFYNIQKAFMLCRSVTGQTKKSNSGIFSFEPRGLIGFRGLKSDGFWDELIERARKDSVRALKKRNCGNWSIKCTRDEEDLSEFLSMYKRLNKARGIADLYHFEGDKLRRLLTSPSWHLLKVYFEDFVLGFTIVARHGENVDQVVLVYDQNVRDASRFVVYCSLEFAANNLVAGEYFMGGGITENDSLEEYKLSLGALKENATVLKYCSYDAPDFEDGLELRGVRWP